MKIIRVSADATDFDRLAETKLLGYRVISSSHNTRSYNKSFPTPDGFDPKIWGYSSFIASVWIDAMFVVEELRRGESIEEYYGYNPNTPDYP